MKSEELTNRFLRVEVDTDDLSISVETAAEGMKWRFGGNPDGDIVVDHGATEGVNYLHSATARQVRRYRNAQEDRLAIFLEGLPGDTGVTLTFGLPENEPALRVEVEATPTASRSRVRQIRYPGPLAFESASPKHTVWPFQAGTLLPDNWPNAVFAEGQALENRMGFNRGLYAPWWGVVADRGAYLAIAETPFDFAFDIRHPAGGPTLTRPVWMPSHGHLAYPRAIRYHFYDEADHVTLAKTYRDYAKRIDRWVSLEEKFDRNPIARRLIGSTIFPVTIYRRDVREGLPPKTVLNTFRDRASQVRRLKALGREKVYLHIDGWGHQGYDSQHPDVFPPCPQAGGWEGLINLSRVADECGFLFGLHDQYRDYFLDGPQFSEKRAVKQEDSSLPQWNRWLGGEQSVLCAKESLIDIRRNFTELLGQGVKLSASYLDVFAIVQMDECFDPAHPMTREDCYRWRARGLDHVRSLGIAISSEEPVDCFIPHLDFAHWADYPRKTFMHGGTIGIPAPLHNLVYHDALLLPAVFDYGKDESQRAIQFMEGVSQVEIPYGRIDWERAEDFHKVDILASLHELWATAELVGHRLLNDEGTVQEFEYPEGTVSIDYDSTRYRIEGGPMDTGDWLSVDP